MIAGQTANDESEQSAFYDPEVIAVCLNCRRPNVEVACGYTGCPAFRAAMKRAKAARRKKKLEAIQKRERRAV